jgi:enterochelin esterase-like enzyme
VLRRRFLASAAALPALFAQPGAARAATPASDDLEQHDLRLDGDADLARRSLLLVPKHVPAGKKLPLLILLHGLGETGNELLGIHAWGELYGLVKAYERLRRPPVRRTLERKRYLTDERVAELETELKARPFRGLVVACPVTPNPHKHASPQRALDRYALWLEKTLIPAVKARAPIADGQRAVGLGGCSLGGYVGIEVFLRKPELFATFGGVQSAFSVPMALRYAERIAKTVEKLGARAIQLESSSLDPFRKANEALARRLRELGVAGELRVPPGPHDQPWLREIGTLEALLWQDRELGR